MTNKKPQKNPEEFCCEKCDFKCSNKKDYKRHISTRKHEILTNPNKKTQKTPYCFFVIVENNTNIGLHYRHIKRNVIMKVMKVMIHVLKLHKK